MTCDHPNCQLDIFDEYEDENGNTLDLCQTHFYEAVTGRRVKSEERSTFTGLGVGSRGSEIGTASREHFEDPAFGNLDPASPRRR